MLAFGGKEDSDHISTVAGFFTGIVSLFLALADFFREEPPTPDPAALADDLALNLAEQWLEEATARGLRDPRVLPLTWSSTSRDVVQLPRTAGTRVLRMRLNGRLDGQFDEAIAQLTDDYRQLPGGRLVVLGEPGSGKSVLAILLTLGLLKARAPGGPLPVLLPASSWDPVRESLDDWIVRTLALPYYSGRPEIPRTLLAHGLLLPVPDGLDEIPESARRSAVRGINLALGTERPVVVTCRAAEYEDLIRGGAPTLRAAPVVEVSPLPPGDVIAYLRDVDWPRDVDWTPVYTHLRSRRDSPLAAAMSTPLMVTSARLVHERLELDPRDLQDSARFDSRLAVEQHLIGQLIDAAYAPDPRRPDPDRRMSWTAGQARRWLTFLAHYLHDHRERDLAWWRMSERLLSPWFTPVFGIAAGLLLGLGSLVWIVGTGVLSWPARKDFPLIGGSIGGGFALLVVIIWHAAPGRPPGRLSFSLRGSLGRLRRGFRHGVMLTAFAVAPVLLVITIATALGAPDGPGSFDAIETYYEMVSVGLCLVLVIGLALAAHNWLDAPPHQAAQASPGRSVAQDRMSALAGCVVSATGLSGWYAGIFSGAWLSRELNDWVGYPGRRNVSLLAQDKWHAVTGYFGGNAYAVLGLTVLLPGAVFGLLLLLTRARPRFVLLTFCLAARGRLPLRLSAFLADARRRELLRQSGSVYQFRHVRLQETLAGQPLYEDGEQPAVASRAVRRRLVLTAGAVATATAAVSGSSGSRDQSYKVFAMPEEAEVLEFHPSGETRLAIGSGMGTVWLWDWANGSPSPGGQLIRDGSEYSSVSGLSLHPRRPLLAVSDALLLEVWNTRTGRRVRRLPTDPNGPKGSPVFSPHGDYLVLSDSARFKLWHLGSGDTIGNVFARPVQDVPSSLVFRPRTDELISLDDRGDLRRFSLPSLEEEAKLLTHPPSADGESYASSSGLSANWDQHLVAFMRHSSLSGESRAEVWTLSGTQVSWPDTRERSTVHDLALSPTAPLLATCDNRDLHLWRYISGGNTVVHLHTFTGHTSWINAVRFSPNGALIATASADRTVRLWRTDRRLP